MKRIIIVVDLMILASLVGFFIGRAAEDRLGQYDERADKTWRKVEKADTPPVTEDSAPKQIEKIRTLYRKVFDRYPDSHWSDDALYQYASRLAISQEQQFSMFRRLIIHYPDSEYADDSLYAIAYANYRLAEERKATSPELASQIYTMIDLCDFLDSYLQTIPAVPFTIPRYSIARCATTVKGSGV